LLNNIYTAEYNETFLPYTNFWKGEIAFRTNTFDSAVFYLTNYLKSPATYGEVNITNAKYTLGYSLLRQGVYDEALKNFEAITKNHFARLYCA